MNSVSPSDQTMETSEKKVPIKSSVNESNKTPPGNTHNAGYSI